MASRPVSAYRQRILDDHLSCSICHEPYARPKDLPCQHSFCQECLEKQQRASTGRSLQCSVCHHLVTLPPEGVAGLPNNHLLANLCEEFSKKTQVGAQKNRCGFHPTKDVDLFCQQCEVPVCSECISDGHPGHKVTGIKQVAEQIKTNIKEQLNSGQQKMETFSAFLKKIQDVQKRLKGNKTQVQQEINKAYEVQVQKLQEQRDGLLASVDKSHHDNMAVLDGQTDIVLTQLTELSRVCEELVEQDDPVSLTQDMHLAQKLAEFETTQTPEICETKLCRFEPKKPGIFIELGKVTSTSMSNKQALVQTRETNTGQVKRTESVLLTCPVSDVDSIKVGQSLSWTRKVRFGEEGSGKGEFKCPLGAAVSQDNEVYITDGTSRIQVFTMDGIYIREFTTTLPGETGEEFQPDDVAVDRNGNLWVVGDDHVVQYSREGTGLVKIDLPHVEWHRGIAVAMATEQVIVTEYYRQNGQLRGFKQDGSEVSTYGSGHQMSPEPCRSIHVTVDGEGNILVTDNNNHCVHVLDSEGKFKFKFGSEGSDESQLNDPQGICVDGMGNIIVADRGNSCVKMFDSQGRFLCHIGSGMEGPFGVAVSPGGDVVVTDVGGDTASVSVWTQG
ncbi:tripartite motif-containing protein 3-like [Branchiostoma floridae x Branchiostoma japonicum]